MMATGTVHTWSQGRGSGWIKPDGGGSRIYVHKSGVTSTEPGRAPRLETGQRVEYQIGQRPGGSAAIGVIPSSTQAPVRQVDETASADVARTPAAAEADEPVAENG